MKIFDGTAFQFDCPDFLEAVSKRLGDLRDEAERLRGSIARREAELRQLDKPLTLLQRLHDVLTNYDSEPMQGEAHAQG